MSNRTSDPFSRGMLPIMLAFVTPSCSVKTAWGAMSDLCRLHLCCPTDTQHSSSGYAFAKNWLDVSLLSESQADISRTLQESIHHHNLSSLATCSQLHSPTLNSYVLSEVQQNWYLTYHCSCFSCCSASELQKSATTPHKKTLSSTRVMLLVCSEKSQRSREQHQEPKLTNSTAHTTCRQQCFTRHEECQVLTKENTGYRRFPFP